ncbi:hypothetical protein H4R18_003082 [Coemansia javaensis]|uniref:Major facilitator superfamily (MFS) profile domain-containing protein n=1 Tax=Coemansia javaensis TaxID=2761396 RepID=A0A9W8LIY9_9FUNG|nr:hypothetical protein H4R18_003082 [Coemansia javaensis]
MRLLSWPKKPAGPGSEEAAAETASHTTTDRGDPVACDGDNGGDDDDDGDRDEKNLHVAQSVFSAMPLRKKIMTMAALSLSVFIGSLEQTIVAGAIPSIGEGLGALDSISWISTSFLLASTAMQPLYGRLSDIFGRIEVLVSGLLVFLAGSAVCGAAHSMGMLIGGRVVQGLGASALISLVMVIVSDISIERERAKITGVFAGIWALSSVLGPVLGGVFSESRGGWPWVFYFSLPVGGVAGVCIVLFLRLPRPAGSFAAKLRRIDFAGMAVLVGAVVMILLALSFGGRQHPWASPTVLCLLLFGVAALGLFALVEWKVPAEPILPLRLFRSRNVGVVLVQQALMGALLFGPPFHIPLFFSVVQNSSSIGASLHLLPFLLPIALMSTVVGFAVSKTGRYREFIWAGSAIATAGAGLLVLLDQDVTLGKSIGLMVVSGIGLGILMQPQLLCLQTAIQGRDVAVGTTLYVALRSLGGGIGLAVFQSVMQNQLAKGLVAVYAAFPADAAIIDAAIRNQAAIHAPGVPDALRDALIAAYVKALRAVFYSLIPFGGLMFVLSLSLRHIPLRTKMATIHREPDSGTKDR